MWVGSSIQISNFVLLVPLTVLANTILVLLREKNRRQWKKLKSNKVIGTVAFLFHCFFWETREWRHFMVHSLDVLSRSDLCWCAVLYFLHVVYSAWYVLLESIPVSQFEEEFDVGQKMWFSCLWYGLLEPILAILG